MLKKRLIGVITVKDDLVVQSMRYKKYLPIGCPKIIAENLERWGADEIICLSIDRSKNDLGPDFSLIKSLASIPLSTPLTYGGGIRNAEDAAEVIKLGVERIVVDNIFQNEYRSIYKISEKIGSQAFVISLPLCINNEKCMIFDYIHKQLVDINLDLEKYLQSSYCSEIMLIDKSNEGIKNGFQKKILDSFPIKNKKLIIFGGLNNPEMMKYVLSKNEVAAIAIGNSLNYKEHSIQKIKEALRMDCLRERIYGIR